MNAALPLVLAVIVVPALLATVTVVALVLAVCAPWVLPRAWRRVVAAWRMGPLEPVRRGPHRVPARR